MSLIELILLLIVVNCFIIMLSIGVSINDELNFYKRMSISLLDDLIRLKILANKLQYKSHKNHTISGIDLSDKELMFIIKNIHPDKHSNSNFSKELTQKLLNYRRNNETRRYS